MTLSLAAYWNKLPNDIFELIELTTDNLENYDYTNQDWFNKSSYQIYQVYLKGMGWIDTIQFPIRVIIGKTMEEQPFLIFEKGAYTISHYYLGNKIMEVLDIK